MYRSSTGLVIIVLIYLLFFGGYLLTRIMLALAVFYDAKAKANEQPLMWALLVGFLGLVPGIIYLCMRKNPDSKMIYCMKCGMMHKMSLPACPQCGEINPFAAQYHDPLVPEYAKKAKRYLYIAIASAAIFFLLVIISLVVAASV